MAKICFVVASPMTIRAFLLDHLRALQEHSIVLVADFGSSPDTGGFPPNARCIAVPIQRKIRLWQDLKALTKLILLMRRERFDLVFSHTPKAGLLAMLAARATGVPVRISAFTGQVWATKRGLFRMMLKSLDRLTAACATEALVDSRGQRDFLLREKVLREESSSVIADGSICGADTARFRPNPELRKATRARLQIPDDAFVFLFMGRMYREKGVFELAEAFRVVHDKAGNTRLLLVGLDEEGVVPLLQGQAGVLIQGQTEHPESFFAAADVLCLPSHREGFGLVIIEAAACGVPAIGSRIYGISDAIAEGETGLLHEVMNAEDLARCMKLLEQDRDLTARMGERASRRVERLFSKERVVGWFADRLRSRLTAAGG